MRLWHPATCTKLLVRKTTIQKARHVHDSVIMLAESDVKEFSNADFCSLAKIGEPVCLSIFVPNAGGEQAALAHSPAALKDLLVLAHDRLRDSGLQSADILDFLAPIENLFARDLWHGRQQTLAVF